MSGPTPEDFALARLGWEPEEGEVAWAQVRRLGWVPCVCGGHRDLTSGRWFRILYRYDDRWWTCLVQEGPDLHKQLAPNASKLADYNAEMAEAFAEARERAKRFRRGRK